MGLFGKEKAGSASDIYGNKGSDKKRRRTSSKADEIHHSRYYHKYYRGYTEVRTPSTNKYKPYRSTMIYTAPYVTADSGRVPYIFYKFLYILLTLISVITYIVALTDRQVPGNTSILVAAAGLPEVILMILLTVCMIAYLARPIQMTLWEYHSSTKRLKVIAPLTALFSMAAAICSGIYLIIHGITNPMHEIVSIVLLVISAAAAAAIFFLEYNLDYKEIANNNKLPEGEYHEIW